MIKKKVIYRSYHQNGQLKKICNYKNGKILRNREVPNLRHCCVLKNCTHANKKCII